MSFEIAENVDAPAIFVLKRSDLRGRLDVEYNFALLNTRISSSHPHYQLREIASTKTGGTPSKSNLDYWIGDIPWASPKDFGSFHLVSTEDHISQAAVDDSSTTVVPKGTLLVVYRSGILQHSMPITITTRATAINQDLKALLFGNEISVEYIGAFFVVFGRRLLPLITKSGATVQSINTEQFERLEIPIPPQHIQQEIASKLLTAFAEKQSREAKARELLASIDDVLLAELGITLPPEPPNTLDNRVFRTMFSETTGKRFDAHYSQPRYKLLQEELQNLRAVKLQELSTAIFSGTTPLSGGDAYTEDTQGIAFVRSGDFYEDGSISTQKLLRVKPEIHNTVLQSSKLAKGDVLFAIVGATIGKVGSFNENYEANINQAICAVRFGAEVLPAFAHAFFLSSLGQEQISRVKRPVAQANINLEEISNLVMPVPPLHIQAEICEKVAQVRNEAQNLRQEAAAQLEAAKHEIEALILGTATTD